MVRRTLGLVVAVIAVGIVAAAPARAGGPTSVLLSAPPHVVAFGYDDPQYADLKRLTDVAASRDGYIGDPEAHGTGSFVRATWLIHDMSVWRIDIIYPDAPGGPWIATTESLDGSTMPTQPRWHTATDPVRLLKLLGSLKLLAGERNGEPSYGGPTSFGGPTGFGRQPEAAPATQPAAEPPASSQTAAADIFTGWRWIIPGFLLGAVVAVVAVRLLPKRRDWQLIDVE
jgi:hypothetical protein